MKTFAELKNAISESTKIKRKYKGVPYYISNLGSMYTLYVDNEKVDTYKSEKDGHKAAKEFIDLAK